VRRLALLVCFGIALQACGPRDPYSGPVRFPVSHPASKTALFPITFGSNLQTFLARRDLRLTADGGVELDFGADGWRFQPVLTAQLCLVGHEQNARRADAAAKAAVLRAAQALGARGERSGDGLLWRYPLPNRGFGAGAGWISGMAQGLAMGCFAAAHTLSKERRFLDMTAEAFTVLRAPFGDTGTATDVGGGVFFEEVAGRGAAPAHILNGHVFALAGLWLASRIDKRATYRDAIRLGLASTRQMLGQYELGRVSLYDLGPRGIASLGGYNGVHIAQLQWLHEITRRSEFLAMALRLARNESAAPYALEPVEAQGIISGVRSWVGKAGAVVDLSARLIAPAPVTALHFVAPGNGVPAAVAVDAGRGEKSVHPDGRYFSVPLGGADVERLRIRLTPQKGSRAGLTLLLVETPSRPTVLASDLSAYLPLPPGESWHPPSLIDSDPATTWSSSLPGTGLIVDLGATGHPPLSLDRCENRRGPTHVAFGRSITRWTSERKLSDTGRIVVPAVARYVLLRWQRKSACLKELR
jgi:hypothetical protein